MPITHETIIRNGHTLDLLADAVNGLRIAVTRKGAELVSIERRNPLGDWIGFLHRDGDVTPAVGGGWNNHATLMGYYIHRIKDERSMYRGQEIHGGTHSFLRHKTFGAPQGDVVASSALTYGLEPGQFSMEEYPFKVAFKISYSLNQGSLKITFHFENREAELTSHVSFGLHPGFAATSLDSAVVMMPAGKYIRHMAPGNFLSGNTVEIDFEGGPMPFRKSDLPGSFLLDLEKIDLPLFTFADRESGREVMLNYSGAPYLTIWSSGEAFICVEPCWGLPDHHRQRPFEEKLGINEIEPGGTLTRSITIAPGFSATDSGGNQ